MGPNVLRSVTYLQIAFDPLAVSKQLLAVSYLIRLHKSLTPDGQYTP